MGLELGNELKGALEVKTEGGKQQVDLAKGFDQFAKQKGISDAKIAEFGEYIKGQLRVVNENLARGDGEGEKRARGQLQDFDAVISGKVSSLKQELAEKSNIKPLKPVAQIAVEKPQAENKTQTAQLEKKMEPRAGLREYGNPTKIIEKQMKDAGL